MWQNSCHKKKVNRWENISVNKLERASKYYWLLEDEKWVRHENSDTSDTSDTSEKEKKYDKWVRIKNNITLADWYCNFADKEKNVLCLKMIAQGSIFSKSVIRYVHKSCQYTRILKECKTNIKECKNDVEIYKTDVETCKNDSKECLSVPDMKIIEWLAYSLNKPFYVFRGSIKFSPNLPKVISKGDLYALTDQYDKGIRVKCEACSLEFDVSADTYVYYGCFYA
jgi:hypothetical protein